MISERSSRFLSELYHIVDFTLLLKAETRVHNPVVGCWHFMEVTLRFDLVSRLVTEVKL